MAIYIHLSGTEDAGVINHRIVLILLLTQLSPLVQAACVSPVGNAGTLQLVSGKLRYCNDTNWIDTSVSTLSSCVGTAAGTINYNAGLRYCDGTNWISMMGPTLSSCSGEPTGKFSYDSGIGHYRVCDGTNWKRMSPPTALTIDTTVARVGSNVANGIDLSSASFTPPSNSLLLVCLNSDTLTNSSTDVVVEVKDSALHTWTNAVENDANSGPASSVGSHASIWYTQVTTASAMTVSARRVSGDVGDSGLTFKVYIITGHNPSSPIGATGKNISSGVNNITIDGYTSTVSGSRGFGCATDWDARGAPSSTDVSETNQALVSNLSFISSYKATDTATAATVVPFNFDAAGSTTTRWRWTAVEIKPAP